MGHAATKDAPTADNSNRDDHEPDWETPADVSGVRTRIKNGVVNEAQLLTKALLIEARAGHPQILKYLFEMVGLFPFEEQEDSAKQAFLAQILLEHLGIDQATLEKRLREAEAQSKMNPVLQVQSETSDQLK